MVRRWMSQTSVHFQRTLLRKAKKRFQSRRQDHSKYGTILRHRVWQCYTNFPSIPKWVSSHSIYWWTATRIRWNVSGNRQQSFCHPVMDDDIKWDALWQSCFVRWLRYIPLEKRCGYAPRRVFHINDDQGRFKLKHTWVCGRRWCKIIMWLETYCQRKSTETLCQLDCMDWIHLSLRASLN